MEVGIIVAVLRIDHSNRFRWRIADLMMVKYNDINLPLVEVSYRLDGGGTAVDCKHDVGFELLKTLFK